MIERWDIRCEAGNAVRDQFTCHHLNLYVAAANEIGPALCDEPRVIVDAASGMGHGFAMLGSLGRYVGLDRSPDALKAARERYPAGEFRYADFADSRWLRGTRPDVVVSLETAEHLDDPRIFLRRIALALPVHGLFIFSAPTCLTRDFDLFHAWDLTCDEWGAMLSWAGFTVERTQSFAITGSFREFLHTVPTTWRQKLGVALFDVTHPRYLVDRLINWGWRDRFSWESTLFVCRLAVSDRRQALLARVPTRARIGALMARLDPDKMVD